MIPLVSLLHLVSVAVSSVLAYRLYRSYWQYPSTNLLLFAMFYGLFALSWLVTAVPGVLSNDPYWIMVSNIIGATLVLVSVIVGIYIPFFFLGRPSVGIAFSVAIGIVSIVYLVGRFLYSEPPLIEVFSPYIYWKPVFPVWLRVLSGIITFTGSSIFAGTFFYLGYKNKDNSIVFRRSIFLAVGMCCMMAASFIVQLIPTANFMNIASGTIFIVLGLLVMAHGILHEHKMTFQIK